MAVGADTERVVTYISKEVKELLEQAAKADKRSVSNYIATLIEAAVVKKI